MLKLLPALLLMLPLLCSAQQIFRTTDENGNVVFTDQPPPASETVQEVELHQTNTAKPPTIRPRPATAPQGPAAIVYEIVIELPADETTIAMGPGNFSVSARLEPGLNPGQSLQLLLDDEHRGKPQQSTTWNLTNVFRGRHQVAVALLSDDGKALATSEPITVYVMRPSSNFRN